MSNFSKISNTLIGGEDEIEDGVVTAVRRTAFNSNIYKPNHKLTERQNVNDINRIPGVYVKEYQRNGVFYMDRQQEYIIRGRPNRPIFVNGIEQPTYDYPGAYYFGPNNFVDFSTIFRAVINKSADSVVDNFALSNGSINFYYLSPSYYNKNDLFGTDAVFDTSTNSNGQRLRYSNTNENLSSLLIFNRENGYNEKIKADDELINGSTNYERTFFSNLEFYLSNSSTLNFIVEKIIREHDEKPTKDSNLSVNYTSLDSESLADTNRFILSYLNEYFFLDIYYQNLKVDDKFSRVATVSGSNKNESRDQPFTSKSFGANAVVEFALGDDVIYAGIDYNKNNLLRTREVTNNQDSSKTTYKETPELDLSKTRVYFEYVKI